MDAAIFLIDTLVILVLAFFIGLIAKAIFNKGKAYAESKVTDGIITVIIGVIVLVVIYVIFKGLVVEKV